MQHGRISAIVPAAGFSSRMHRFKPLLPLPDGRTLLASVIHRFRVFGIDEVIVVTGFRSEGLVSAIDKAGARQIVNRDFEKGMFSSILAGIRNLSTDCRAFFLLPADIPAVRPATLAAILSEFNRSPAPVVYPVFDGERGHPPLISTRIAPAILDYAGGGGLRQCLCLFDGEAMDVPVCDRGILMDADTPADYERIVARSRSYHVPDRDECRVLMEIVLRTDPAIIRHGRAVADTALAIARAAPPSLTLDTGIIEAAALLHDIAKNRKNHAEKGAAMIESLGFGPVAGIVRTHMDLNTDAAKPLDEAEVLFLADKLTFGTRFTPDLRQRFINKKKRYKDTPEAGEAIERRLDTALTILAKLPDDLLSSISKRLRP